MKGLEAVDTQKNQIDMVVFLNKQSSEQVKIILDSAGEKYKELKQEKDKLEKSCWNFEVKKFALEKTEFTIDERCNVKAHLHHLAFALHKTLTELQSGGRYRTKYFDEVKNVLTKENHTHPYLKNFCTSLQNGKFKPLTIDNLPKIIGHLSNLELKPLRKYFKNEKHKIAEENKNGDQWNIECLNRIFDRWVRKEWRVGEKDARKKKDADQDYGKLKKDWQGYNENPDKTIIDFWLNTDPVYTIPPYQDNNNRRPPKCQSLILNTHFFEKGVSALAGLVQGIDKY